MVYFCNIQGQYINVDLMLWFITSSFTIQIFVHYNISNDVGLWRTALTTRQFQVHSGINHLYLRKIPWAPQARSISYEWNFIMNTTEPELVHCFEWRVYMDFHFVYVCYVCNCTVLRFLCFVHDLCHNAFIQWRIFPLIASTDMYRWRQNNVGEQIEHGVVPWDLVLENN